MATKVRGVGRGVRGAGKSRIPKASFAAIAASERDAAAKRVCKGAPPLDRAKASVDGEVKEFREAFDGPLASAEMAGADVRQLVKDLGHTPNAMAGAIVDAAKSKRDAPRPSPRSPDAGCQPAEVFESTRCFLIPLSSIVAAPDNARKTFDPAGLASLAAGMKKHGQKTPCQVRPMGHGHYMLVDGERRFRAAKIARLMSLRCEIEDLTDEEAREQALLTNLQREDLDPIERAIGYKQLLDDGRTQQGVAELLGLSGQGAVSNAVRLLALPKEFQAKVSEGKLSETHAVMLIPHARRPAFVNGFLKHAAQLNWDLYPVSQFDEDLEQVYARFADVACYGSGDRQKLAASHREELDVAEVGNVLFVCNKPRWKTLLAEAEKKASAIADRRDARQSNTAKAAAVKLSPAEQKARAKVNAEKHAKRVTRWFTAWLQRRIASRIDPGRPDFSAVEIRLLLLFCVADGRQRSKKDVRDVLGGLGVARAKRGNSYSRDGYDVFTGLSDDQTPAAALGLLKEWVVRDAERPFAHLKPSDVRIIGRQMKVDAGQEWTVTTDFLDLFSKAQLGELAVEWGLLKQGQTYDALKRSQAAAQILDQAKKRRLPTPAILLELAKNLSGIDTVKVRRGDKRIGQPLDREAAIRRVR